jgi:hypothetical protein
MSVSFAPNSLRMSSVVVDCRFVQRFLQAVAVSWSAPPISEQYQVYLRTKSSSSLGLTGLSTKSAALESRLLVRRMNVSRASRAGSSENATVKSTSLPRTNETCPASDDSQSTRRLAWCYVRSCSSSCPQSPVRARYLFYALLRRAGAQARDPGRPRVNGGSGQEAALEGEGRGQRRRARARCACESRLAP